MFYSYFNFFRFTSMFFRRLVNLRLEKFPNLTGTSSLQYLYVFLNNVFFLSQQMIKKRDIFWLD